MKDEKSRNSYNFTLNIDLDWDVFDLNDILETTPDKGSITISMTCSNGYKTETSYSIELSENQLSDYIDNARRISVINHVIDEMKKQKREMVQKKTMMMKDVISSCEAIPKDMRLFIKNGASDGAYIITKTDGETII